MLNAIVLYRFTAPGKDGSAAAESEAAKVAAHIIIPALTRYFRVMTIQDASNVPGTLDYWLRVFEKAELLTDIVVLLELASDRFSQNVISEQISNEAQTAASSTKQVMLSNCMQAFPDAPKAVIAAPAIRESPRELTEFGRTYFVKMTDMPSLRRKSADVGDYEASFMLPPGGSDAGLAGQLDSLFNRVREVCEKREADFRAKFPQVFGLHMRLRQLFEDDPFFRRNLQFHNEQTDLTGLAPDARDDKWRRLVRLMIYDNDEGTPSPSGYAAMPVKPMLVHNTFEKGSFLGYCASALAAESMMTGRLLIVLRSMLGLPPKTVQLPKAIHTVLTVLALIVAVVTWPACCLLVRTRRARKS